MLIPEVLRLGVEFLGLLEVSLSKERVSDVEEEGVALPVDTGDAHLIFKEICTLFVDLPCLREPVTGERSAQG